MRIVFFLPCSPPRCSRLTLGLWLCGCGLSGGGWLMSAPETHPLNHHPTLYIYPAHFPTCFSYSVLCCLADFFFVLLGFILLLWTSVLDIKFWVPLFFFFVWRDDNDGGHLCDWVFDCGWLQNQRVALKKTACSPKLDKTFDVLSDQPSCPLYTFDFVLTLKEYFPQLPTSVDSQQDQQYPPKTFFFSPSIFIGSRKNSPPMTWNVSLKVIRRRICPSC